MVEEHTPGPWINLHWGVGGDGCKVSAVAMRGPNILALVRAPMTLMNPESGYYECRTRDVAECEANARLIAAAPELLIACKQLLLHVEGDEATHGRPFGAGNYARSVLEKIHTPED